MSMTLEKKHPSPLTRRGFLRAGALGASTLILPDKILAEPFRKGIRRAIADPVRVRGRVQAGGQGLGGVAISDGWDVVVTDGDGLYEFISTADRDFIRMTVPSGFEIPRNPSGTASFYHPMTPNASGEMEAVFDLEPLQASDEDHALFLLADIQVETPQEMGWFHEQTIPDLRATLESIGSPVAVGEACGDTMYDHPELWADYKAGVVKMGIPFFQVAGNHDLDHDAGTDDVSTLTFSSHFGPRYYSFDRGAVHYVVLDDVFWHGTGYLGYIGSDQLRWLKNDLSFVEAGRPVIVSAHIPVLGGRHVRLGNEFPAASISVSNRRMLYQLLEPYQAHILTGHTHENEHVFEAGTHEHVVAAVCGGWWTGPICGDGTPQGYAVYEIRGEEVTWRYKSTGHSFDHQLRAYPRGADPEAPDEIVANVWDWDPEWSVVWYEDGERKGEMARRVGTDPLSRELLAGDVLPTHHPWVDPYIVGHLFYAPASSSAGEIRVEATDRFGRVYSATL
jgi:hypothetical protein